MSRPAIEIHALHAIGEVEAGSELAPLLGAALDALGLRLQPSDVVVVTQKIVSKAENRFVSLEGVVPGEEALRLARVTGKDPRLVERVLAESAAVVRAAPNVLITRHRLGYVMANAGIDRSNVGPSDQVLLLPEDPDHSAAQLRRGLGLRYGVEPAVVISDSFGRPWRNGVVNVALGSSGLLALADRRGEMDRQGRPLEVTQVAVADLIASAAGLAMGEAAEGIPAVLVRGAVLRPGSVPASALIRPLDQDLFQ